MNDSDLRNIALSQALAYSGQNPIPPAKIVEVAAIFLSFLTGTSA